MDASLATGSARRPGIGVVASSICVCHRPDPLGQYLMLPCADGTGGCNGWVHPQCVCAPSIHWKWIFDAKPAPPDVLQPYVCPMCIRAAVTGKVGAYEEAPLMPPPLAPNVWVIEKIIARRERAADSSATHGDDLAPGALSATSSTPGTEGSLHHVAGHSHLFDAAAAVGEDDILVKAGGEETAAAVAALVPPAANSSSGSGNRALTKKVTEYLIKWKNQSYLHCTWETEESLVEFEHLAANSDTVDEAAGVGGGASLATSKARVANRIRRYMEREARERNSSSVDHLASAVAGEGGDDASATLARNLGFGVNAAREAGEEPDDGDYFDPDFTYAERIIAATVPASEDYFVKAGAPKPASASTHGGGKAGRGGNHRRSSASSGAHAATSLSAQPGLQHDEVLEVGPPAPMYLVKWLSLPYSECTWESGEDVGADDKIRAFRLRELVSDEVVATQSFVAHAMLNNPQWTKALAAPYKPLKLGTHTKASGGAGKKVAKPGAAARGGGARGKKKRAADEDGEEAGLNSEDEREFETAEFVEARAAEAAAHAKQLQDEAKLMQGWMRVPAKACAHLTNYVPRLSHPPQHCFTSVPTSPNFGVPLRSFKTGTVTAAAGAAGNAATASATGSAAAPDVEGMKLHAYQLEGLNWLLFNYFQGRGGILADEMGLGKTAQAISFMHALSSYPQGWMRHLAPGAAIAAAVSASSGTCDDDMGDGVKAAGGTSSTPRVVPATIVAQEAAATGAGGCGSDDHDDDDDDDDGPVITHRGVKRAPTAPPAPTAAGDTKKPSAGTSTGGAAPPMLPGSTKVSAATASALEKVRPFAHRRGPFLVVTPLSTLGHWMRELENWTAGCGMVPRSAAVDRLLASLPPEEAAHVREAAESASLNVVMYHGPLAARAVIREREFYFTDADTGVQLSPPLHAVPSAVVDGLTRDVRKGFALSGAKAAIAAAATSAEVGVRMVQSYKFDVMVSTYEMIISDAEYLSAIPWSCIVVDEAHRLKNSSSKLFQTLNSWPRDHCVLLTGTPIQNNIEELWALLAFLAPAHFVESGMDFRDAQTLEKVALTDVPHEAAGTRSTAVAPRVIDHATFMRCFGKLERSAQISVLHVILRPYVLRRLKEDVQMRLPPKEETLIEVEMTLLQKQYYRAIYERNVAFLTANNNQTPSLMNIVMELRKACNHPYLLKGVEDVCVARCVTSMVAAAKAEGRQLTKHEVAASVNEQFVSCSGKFTLLDKLLPKLRAGGHRVLIFSQMVRTLDIIADYASYRKYPYERLDGRIRGQERQGAIDRFSSPTNDAFLMLLSTRAGGLGINLTAADTVIIFDSDWNPQNDLQAQARVHRIGQKSAVKIYRLLTRKTYEQVMFHRASLKLGLDRAVIGQLRAEEVAARAGAAGATKQRLAESLFASSGAGKEGGSSAGSGAMTPAEVESLLKRGAYDVFNEAEEEAAASSRAFTDEDIDSILSRSTTLLRYEDGRVSDGPAAAAALSSMSFSKASFVTENAVEVDMDDPNFWQKTLGSSTMAAGGSDAAAAAALASGPGFEEAMPHDLAMQMAAITGVRPPSTVADASDAASAAATAAAAAVVDMYESSEGSDVEADETWAQEIASTPGLTRREIRQLIKVRRDELARAQKDARKRKREEVRVAKQAAHEEKQDARRLSVVSTWLSHLIDKVELMHTRHTKRDRRAAPPDGSAASAPASKRARGGNATVAEGGGEAADAATLAESGSAGAAGYPPATQTAWDVLRRCTTLRPSRTWTAVEARRFYTAIRDLPIGRWDAMRERHDFMHRSPTELKIITRMFVQFVLQVGGVQVYNAARALLASKASAVVTQADGSLFLDASAAVAPAEEAGEGGEEAVAAPVSEASNFLDKLAAFGRMRAAISALCPDIPETSFQAHLVLFFRRRVRQDERSVSGKTSAEAGSSGSKEEVEVSASASSAATSTAAKSPAKPRKPRMSAAAAEKKSSGVAATGDDDADAEDDSDGGFLKGALVLERMNLLLMFRDAVAAAGMRYFADGCRAATAVWTATPRESEKAALEPLPAACLYPSLHAANQDVCNFPLPELLDGTATTARPRKAGRDASARSLSASSSDKVVEALEQELARPVVATPSDMQRLAPYFTPLAPADVVLRDTLPAPVLAICDGTVTSTANTSAVNGVGSAIVVDAGVGGGAQMVRAPSPALVHVATASSEPEVRIRVRANRLLPYDDAQLRSVPVQELRMRLPSLPNREQLTRVCPFWNAVVEGTPQYEAQEKFFSMYDKTADGVIHKTVAVHTVPAHLLSSLPLRHSSDRDYILGTCKHGIMNVATMMRDPDLVFRSLLQAVYRLLPRSARLASKVTPSMLRSAAAGEGGAGGLPLLMSSATPGSEWARQFAIPEPLPPRLAVVLEAANKSRQPAHEGCALFFVRAGTLLDAGASLEVFDPACGNSDAAADLRTLIYFHDAAQRKMELRMRRIIASWAASCATHANGMAPIVAACLTRFASCSQGYPAPTYRTYDDVLAEARAAISTLTGGSSSSSSSSGGDGGSGGADGPTASAVGAPTAVLQHANDVVLPPQSAASTLSSDEVLPWSLQKKVHVFTANDALLQLPSLNFAPAVKSLQQQLSGMDVVLCARACFPPGSASAPDTSGAAAIPPHPFDASVTEDDAPPPLETVPATVGKPGAKAGKGGSKSSAKTASSSAAAIGGGASASAASSSSGAAASGATRDKKVRVAKADMAAYVPLDSVPLLTPADVMSKSPIEWMRTRLNSLFDAAAALGNPVKVRDRQEWRDVSRVVLDMVTRIEVAGGDSDKAAAAATLAAAGTPVKRGSASKAAASGDGTTRQTSGRRGRAAAKEGGSMEVDTDVMAGGGAPDTLEPQHTGAKRRRPVGESSTTASSNEAGGVVAAAAASPTRTQQKPVVKRVRTSGLGAKVDVAALPASSVALPTLTAASGAGAASADALSSPVSAAPKPPSALTLLTLVAENYVQPGPNVLVMPGPTEDEDVFATVSASPAALLIDSRTNMAVPSLAHWAASVFGSGGANAIAEDWVWQNVSYAGTPLAELRAHCWAHVCGIATQYKLPVLQLLNAQQTAIFHRRTFIRASQIAAEMCNSAARALAQQQQQQQQHPARVATTASTIAGVASSPSYAPLALPRIPGVPAPADDSDVPAPVFSLGGLHGGSTPQPLRPVT